MIQGFIIMFRETLEAALIISIVLGYLRKSGHWDHRNTVFFGLLCGIAFSIIGALIFNAVAGGIAGTGEQIFEGLTMLVGAALLTTMILWMMRQHGISREIEQKVESHITHSRKLGLFFLVFVSVLREGNESVIFLSAAGFASYDRNLGGALLGIFAAAILGYLLFIGSLRLKLGKFFALTNVLLILFAAGLVAQGLHELQGAGFVPVVIEHVWDMNPGITAPGSYPLLHEEGTIGSIAKGLFGYNGDPSLVEVVAYGAYLIVVILVWRLIRSKGSRKHPA